MKKFIYLIITFSTTIIVGCKSQGTLKLTENGKIESGKVNLKCDKPQKTYTKAVDIALKGSVAKLESTEGVDLNATVKTEVVKLTQYSQQGLDLDLLIFRMCQMTNNKAISSEQAQEIITLAMKTWNNKMSINEQKNVISQLKVELDSNLKTANELKLNIETVLSSLNLISGDQVLRNSKIQISPILFPISNLDKSPVAVSDMVNESITKYLSLNLNTNELEQQKFSATGKLIALTLDKTIPTFNSLADRDGNRYPIYSTIWNANSNNLSKIDVYDITKFQKTYSELNSLKANYDIVINRATDYLTDLSKFFKPENNQIKKEDLEKILTSERFAYDLILTYSKSLVENIENLSKLQQTVDESLK
ncbi:MAG: hypothetical protein QM535_18180 [Limnohabitans sp.]|nr:hypothetical protein [Limnohabitans sp.]